MRGKELMVGERSQMGPVAPADDDNQGLAMRVAWPRPPPQRAYAYEAQVHGLVVENRVSFWG